MTGLEVFERRDELLAEIPPMDPYRRAGWVRDLFAKEATR